MIDYDKLGRSIWPEEEPEEDVEEPEGPESEPVLTQEQQEFMSWFNSLNLPDCEET